MPSAQKPQAARIGVLMIMSAALATFSMGRSAHAQDQGVVFAGADAGSDQSAYVGATEALPGSSFGHGFAIRAIVSQTNYAYTGGTARIDGRELGIDLAGVYQWSGDWGYANVAAGPRYHDTHLSPADPGNRSNGPKWDGFVAVDGARNFDRWRVAGFASYGAGLGEYYTRVELTRVVAGPVRLGVEAVAQGDPNYNRQLYGPVLVFSPAAKWEVRFSGGVEQQQQRSGAYGGLFFSRVF